MRVVVAAILVAVASSQPARAQDTVPARQLQTRVWANLTSKIYHCPSSRFFGETVNGEFMSEARARGRGYRAEGGRGCRGGIGPTQAPLPRADSSGVFVWINTASNIYHCPGTTEYGRTKTGRYQSEAAAHKAGKRPANGRVCD